MRGKGENDYTQERERGRERDGGIARDGGGDGSARGGVRTGDRNEEGWGEKERGDGRGVVVMWVMKVVLRLEMGSDDKHE